MLFANITPEAIDTVNSATSMSNTTIIVVTICATIIILALIFFKPNFKVRKCKDGVTLKVGNCLSPEAVTPNEIAVKENEP